MSNHFALSLSWSEGPCTFSAFSPFISSWMVEHHLASGTRAARCLAAATTGQWRRHSLGEKVHFEKLNVSIYICCFTYFAGWAGGIPQPKNGPCGVIAVVHALVLAKQYARPIDQIKASQWSKSWTDGFLVWIPKMTIQSVSWQLSAAISLRLFLERFAPRMWPPWSQTSSYDVVKTAHRLCASADPLPKAWGLELEAKLELDFMSSLV